MGKCSYNAKMYQVHNMVSPKEKKKDCLSINQGPGFSVVGVERGMCSFPEEEDKMKTRTRRDAGVPLRPGL